ncbi:MAG: hypothetical protein ACI9S8_001219 [Chlamydiales bacterium]|jgi:hypothetical protein
MSHTNQNLDKFSLKELQGKLEELIANAIQKIGGNKENDLCKFLPVPTGGYMHHFTLRKMKVEEPEKLLELIRKFIIKVEKPGKVDPKPRAARGSRKKRDQIVLSKTDLDRMLNIARLAGDKEMISKLTPKKSLTQIRRDLISSIRQGKGEQELWNVYVEALANQTTLNGTQTLQNLSL